MGHFSKAPKGKPETFDFLGFTHICGKKRNNGYFTVLRQTIRKRLQAKLNEVKEELRRRMHDPIPKVGQWLRSVVEGHFRYYGVPMNGQALGMFRSGSAGSGIGRFRAEAREAVFHGAECCAYSTTGCLKFGVYHPFPLRRMGVIT